MADEKEILIEPLINVGPGICTECGSPLIVMDSELTVMELNDEGQPITEETTMRVIGGCTRCGKKYNMMRFDGKYIPYSESSCSHIIKTMELRDRIQDRVSKLNEKCKGDNPLAFK